MKNILTFLTGLTFTVFFILLILTPDKAADGTFNGFFSYWFK